MLPHQHPCIFRVLLTLCTCFRFLTYCSLPSQPSGALRFVAQSAGIAHLGPHSFNAARFLLGAASLVPLWFIFSKIPQGKLCFWEVSLPERFSSADSLFQQMGLLHTTAGNAGFYYWHVYCYGACGGGLSRPPTNLQTWSGVVLAVIGLYCCLSIGPDFTMAYGDLLELIGAFGLP